MDKADGGGGGGFETEGGAEIGPGAPAGATGPGPRGRKGRAQGYEAQHGSPTRTARRAAASGTGREWHC